LKYQTEQKCVVEITRNRFMDFAKDRMRTDGFGVKGNRDNTRAEECKSYANPKEKGRSAAQHVALGA